MGNGSFSQTKMDNWFTEFTNTDSGWWTLLSIEGEGNREQREQLVCLFLFFKEERKGQASYL